MQFGGKSGKSPGSGPNGSFAEPALLAFGFCRRTVAYGTESPAWQIGDRVTGSPARPERRTKGTGGTLAGKKNPLGSRPQRLARAQSGDRVPCPGYSPPAAPPGLATILRTIGSAVNEVGCGERVSTMPAT